MEPLAVPMSDLIEVLPHVHFIQTKFFEIDDDLRDLHIPWAEIVSTLAESGWSGWLSSEYEGRREPYRGRDQVRRQHALMRQLQTAKANDALTSGLHDKQTISSHRAASVARWLGATQWTALQSHSQQEKHA